MSEVASRTANLVDKIRSCRRACGVHAVKSRSVRTLKIAGRRCRARVWHFDAASRRFKTHLVAERMGTLVRLGEPLPAF